LRLILLSVVKSSAQNLDYKTLKSINKTEHPSWDKGMQGVSHSIFIVTPLSIAGILTQGYVQKDNVMIRNGYKSAISAEFGFIHVRTKIPGEPTQSNCQPCE
jgi:hypothetical protein